MAGREVTGCGMNKMDSGGEGPRASRETERLLNSTCLWPRLGVYVPFLAPQLPLTIRTLFVDYKQKERESLKGQGGLNTNTHYVSLVISCLEPASFWRGKLGIEGISEEWTERKLAFSGDSEGCVLSGKD